MTSNGTAIKKDCKPDSNIVNHVSPRSNDSLEDFHLQISEDDSPSRSATPKKEERAKAVLKMEPVTVKTEAETDTDIGSFPIADLSSVEVKEEIIGLSSENANSDKEDSVINKIDKKSVDKPSVDKSLEDKPSEDKPSEDKPSEDKPSEDKPSEDKPSDEKQTDTVAGKVATTASEESTAINSSSAAEKEITSNGETVKLNDSLLSEDSKSTKNEEKDEELVKIDESSQSTKKSNKDEAASDDAASKSSPPSPSSGPASVVRTTSVESEDQTASTTAMRIDEPMDEDSSNSAVFMALLAKEGRKRARTGDSESDLELTSSGSKKVRVEKRHCSDGEQELETSASKKTPQKERRSSCSESDMIKDLEIFIQKKTPNAHKTEKWKVPELTPEETKRLEIANAREKKMRENVLRTIQRNYKNMSVEDFEDSIYVAIMDYFCHYNSNALLHRKVLMLEKLVSRLQENYNRTFKQFCEAKYLLRRMVEIRKDEANKCVCKDKLPFKLIRSVAVQVQTARCRGGDLCPGSGIGLDPNFKAGSSTSTKTSPRKAPENAQPTSNSNDTNAAVSVNTSKGSQPSSNAKASQPTGSRHVSVSLPPTQCSNRNTLVRQKSASDLPNGKVPIVVQSPLQRTVARSPQQTVFTPPSKPASQPVAKSNSSIVIDLTDKDEDTTSASSEKANNSGSETSLVKSNVPLQQPVQTRVVKTSVLSPMPQLPPLPPSPMYKAIVRRPPRPVLKVCKADQSGIMLSWTLHSNVPLVNEILFYQVYACQENAGVTREWSTVGDVKALPLPMACTLSQFREGHRYHFVVRAVDTLQILGEFSHPASILLVSKNGTAPNSSNSQPQSGKQSPATSPANRQWPLTSKRTSR